MIKVGGIAAVGGAALIALSVLLAPATSAQSSKAKSNRPSFSFSGQGFTPAIADPKLAAEFARRGLSAGSFRFTPSTASPEKNKAVRVAVRARAVTAAQAARVAGDGTSTAPITAITPTSYNLGVSVGWKRFALSGDVAKVEGGALPGGREAAEVAVGYQGKKLGGRLALNAERSDDTSRVLPEERSVAFDLGASYKLARNLDVTGGVRYKIQNDRLEVLQMDDRRDSQAVYIGTAFRF